MGANYKEKVCKKCGNLYKPTSSTQEWCVQCMMKKCEWCGKEFKMKRIVHEHRAKYCSVECRRMSYAAKMKGENAANFKCGTRMKTLKKVCAMCGEEYSIDPAHYEESRFCGRKCFDNYRSLYMRGENAPGWKGGIAIPRNTVMVRKEYQEWRKAVFERDGYTCQVCGDNRGGNLQAHHIKAYAEYPELRHDVQNGITLCQNCHKKVHYEKLDIQSDLLQ